MARRIIYQTRMGNTPVTGTNSWKERVQADKIAFNSPNYHPIANMYRMRALAVIAMMPCIFSNTPVTGTNKWKERITADKIIPMLPDRFIYYPNIRYSYPSVFGGSISSTTTFTPYSDKIAPMLSDRIFLKDVRYTYQSVFSQPYPIIPSADKICPMIPDLIPRITTRLYDSIFSVPFTTGFIPYADKIAPMYPDRTFALKSLIHLYPTLAFAPLVVTAPVITPIPTRRYMMARSRTRHFRL